MVNNSCGSNASGNLFQTTLANAAVVAADSNGQLIVGVGNGFLSVVNQVFTANGTYTPTSGMVYCYVQCLGAGGAGGGPISTLDFSTSISAGGGAGEYAFGSFSAATIGASKTVTVGAAGAGANGSTGGNGGNTSLGVLISANGGTGGATVNSAVTGLVTGGAGGTGGSGGDYRSNGQDGANGWNINNNLQSGSGGTSQFGAGGLGPLSSVAFAQGPAGTGSGSGGAGTNSFNHAASSGGNGTHGLIIVTEFVS